MLAKRKQDQERIERINDDLSLYQDRTILLVMFGLGFLLRELMGYVA